MRKIIVSMNITQDGFVAGPQSELDWHFSFWTSGMTQSLGEQLSRTDTILLGRVTYSAMADFWSKRLHDYNLPREDLAIASMMNDHRKIVFSKSLKHARWKNSIIIGGEPATEIAKLKSMKGRDMIVYGSSSLVSSLVSWNLVDRYSLWVHPVMLGQGRAFCKSLNTFRDLTPIRVERFGSGVVRSDYNAW